MSYYSKTTLFADGGTFKHLQEGVILHGISAKAAKPTGIIWAWVQHHDGRQAKTWCFAGVTYETFAAARAAYEQGGLA